MRFKIGSLLSLLVVLLSGPILQSAQSEQKPAIHTGKLAKTFKLDGHLDEPAWAQTDSISNLTMIEPYEGNSPTYRTVIKVLSNSDAIVFGIRCTDDAPENIVAYSKKRDAELRREDHIRIVLDTFLDGRSGYVFAINPNAARYDALVSEQRDGENADWDAIWEAKTSIDNNGWSAEIKIPIKSISFKKQSTTWGFNIERRIQRLQETDLVVRRIL